MDYTVSFCYLELYIIFARNQVRDVTGSDSDLEVTATLRFFEKVRMAERSLLPRNMEMKYQSRVAALRN